MNFLLHFRLARRDLHAPAAAIGAMLPDLWRMIDKTVRPARAVDVPAAGRVAEVLAGIDHHTRADAAFHECDAFTDGERALARSLRAIDAPKMVLFAHVAWELCLDGALVRREGGALNDALGEGVARASEREDGETAIEAAGRLHRAGRGRDPLPEGFRGRVAHFVDEIAKGAWIAGYARGPIVAERIEGIRRRLGLGSLASGDRATLGELLDDAIARADGPLDAVLSLPLPEVASLRGADP